MTLLTKPLTSDEILIAKIQREFIADGFQFIEHIYNDHNKSLADCSIRLTKTTSPHAFEFGLEREPNIGWGRFPRIDAWTMAHNWLLDYRRREAKAKVAKAESRVSRR